MITEKGKKIKKRRFINRFNKIKRSFLFILSMIGYLGYIFMNSLTRTERLTYNMDDNSATTVLVTSTLLFVGWLFFYNLDEIKKIKSNSSDYEDDDGDYYNEE